MVGLWDLGVMHHVVVKFGDDCFVDCDGVSSVPQLLLRWEKQEGLIAPRLDQFSSHPDWFCPEDRVAVLSDLLTEFDKAIAIRA